MSLSWKEINDLLAFYKNRYFTKEQGKFYLTKIYLADQEDFYTIVFTSECGDYTVRNDIDRRAFVTNPTFYIDNFIEQLDEERYLSPLYRALKGWD